MHNCCTGPNILPIGGKLDRFVKESWPSEFVGQNVTFSSSWSFRRIDILIHNLYNLHAAIAYTIHTEISFLSSSSFDSPRHIQHTHFHRRIDRSSYSSESFRTTSSDSEDSVVPFGSLIRFTEFCFFDFLVLTSLFYFIFYW